MTPLTDPWTAVAALWPLSVLAAAWLAAAAAYRRGEGHVLRQWARNEEDARERRRAKRRRKRERRKERRRVEAEVRQ